MALRLTECKRYGEPAYPPHLSPVTHLSQVEIDILASDLQATDDGESISIKLSQTSTCKSEHLQPWTPSRSQKIQLIQYPKILIIALYRVVTEPSPHPLHLCPSVCHAL
jgi:hypothetical protein